MSFLRSSLVARASQGKIRSLRLLATSTAPAFKIPVIDFGKFRQAKTQEERSAAAAQVVDALVNAGFMVGRPSSLPSLWSEGPVVLTIVGCGVGLQYLSNHGIPQEEIDKTVSSLPVPSRPLAGAGPDHASRALPGSQYVESAKFFALPTEVKEPLAWKGASRWPAGVASDR